MMATPAMMLPRAGRCWMSRRIRRPWFLATRRDLVSGSSDISHPHAVQSSLPLSSMLALQGPDDITASTPKGHPAGFHPDYLLALPS
jgi:hypothetical protein